MIRTSVSFGVLFSAALALPAQRQLLLPDNHHLTESATQLGSAGATTWWRAPATGGAGGRFQIIYEASHFTGNAGITGPIVITKLKFRGEDGEQNSGGHSWTGVTVELGSTSLDNTNMSTTFATNRLAATTTMGALGTTTVTELPSTGSTPNNFSIEIDLAAIGASIVFDPTSVQRNLLIDITMPTAGTLPPFAGAMMPIQDTSGGAALVRGEGVTAATPGAVTGTTSAAPPVVGLEFAGAGGYAALIPARNEFYGAACGGSPSTFYQSFLNGQVADLTGLTLIPDSVSAPTTYTVVGGAPPFDASKVNAAPNTLFSGSLDDGLVSHALGWTFNFPGGSTATIKPCTNGYVWLDSAPTIADFTPTVAEMLGSAAGLTARMMPLWFDFDMAENVATNPNSGLHVLTEGPVGSQICYVTWFDVAPFNVVSAVGVGGHSVNQLQCVFFEATGIVEFRYGTLPAMANASASTSAALVGFTRGRIGTVSSADPQSRDLSIEVPFTTSVELAGANNMGQTAVATPVAGGAQYSGRMFAGQTLRWNANNVAGVIGAQLLDVGATRPGFQVPGITAPGCVLSTTTGALLWETFILPPASVTGTVPLLVPSGLLGVDIYAQFVVLDGVLPTGGNLITRSSNAIKHTIGLQ
ncbi:MAG: hypothetical protein MUC36_01190 [Planctomycetes bacterium]|jgi:hypothetical protein|nr:hypothetical protein [Planctomycetota bacterium]